MTVRLALASDAAPITAMYNAAVPTINTYWPTGAVVVPQSSFENRIARGQVYVSASSALGAVRGFIARRPRPINGDDGDELDLWIIPTSSTATQMSAWTKELWSKWATDHLVSGEWLWGRDGGAYPVKTETLFQKMVTKGLVVIEARTGHRVSRIRPADLLTVLGQL